MSEALECLMVLQWGKQFQGEFAEAAILMVKRRPEWFDMTEIGGGLKEITPTVALLHEIDGISFICEKS